MRSVEAVGGGVRSDVSGPFPARPRNRSVAAWVLPLWLAGCTIVPADRPRGGQETTDAPVMDAERAEVLEAVQAVFDAINTPDPDLLVEVMSPEGLIVAVRSGADPAVSTVQEMASRLESPGARYTERMWSPEVSIQGPIASVWAPYDFYLDGAFSHCGVDAFHLVRVQGSWRVQSLVYNTLQPPACAVHPEGPPPGQAAARR